MDRVIEYKMKFAERAKLLLAENGMTFKILSDELKVDSQTVSNWLNLKSEPKLSQLIKLTEIFDVSFDYLIGMSDDRKPKNIESLKEDLISEISEVIQEHTQHTINNNNSPRKKSLPINGILDHIDIKSLFGFDN